VDFPLGGETEQYRSTRSVDIVRRFSVQNKGNERNVNWWGERSGVAESRWGNGFGIFHFARPDIGTK